MENVKLLKALPSDAGQMVRLMRERIEWMNREGISGWNKSDYLSVYPLSFFEEKAEKGELYLLKEGERVLGGAVILEEDPRWEKEETLPALYIHNLVSSADGKGAGKEILDQAQTLAEKMGKKALRLDCARSNEPLLHFYAAAGFIRKGECADGEYLGYLLEKRLS